MRQEPAPVEVVAEPPPPWSRSPADILRLIVAAVVVTVALVIEFAGGASLLQDLARLLRGLDVVPTWLVWVVVVSARVFAVVAVAAVVIAALQHRQVRIVVVVALAALAAMGAMALTNSWAPDPVEEVVGLEDRAAAFPTGLGLAAMAAVVTAGAPWLSRSLRRVAWTSLVLLALARFLTTPISFETERAVLLGWLMGAAAVVIAGAPSRRAPGTAVAAGLAAVDVPLRRLEQASLDARGSTPYFAEHADGRRLFVKVVGQDERSADLMFRIYRWLTPRNLVDGRPFASLRHAVEREVLVAMEAGHRGIRTPEVVAFTSAEPHSFVIAYTAIDGKSLDRVDPAEVDDELLRAIWTEVAALRRKRIAHRDLRLANIFVAADRQVWMIDFGFSELAASDVQLANDVVELLVSSSLVVGADRAVANARAVVGDEPLVAAMERLRPWALSGATRTAVKQRPGLLGEIEHLVYAGAVAEADDAEPDTAPDAAPWDAPPEVKPASTKRKVVKSIVAIIVLVAVLWLIFSQFASAGDVWAAITELNAGQVLLLLAATFLNMLTSWVVSVVCTPGLRIRQAAVWNQATAAVSNAMPAGGAVAVGLTYSMLSSWGFAPSRTTLSVIVSGIWNNLAKFGLPIVAFGLVSFQGGHPTAERSLAVIGLGLLIGALVLFALVLRSESLARRIGDAGARFVSRLLRIIGRSPVGGWGDKTVEFRGSIIGFVRHRWLALTVATIVSHLALFLVLLASLRVMGVSDDQIGWAQTLVAFALSRLATMIKVTPGGAGVIELVLIAMLTSVGGEEAAVVAAVFVYRFLTFALTLPFGAAGYVFWLRNTSWRDTAPPPPTWLAPTAAPAHSYTRSAA